jgi:hypothetical protein
MPWHLQLNEHIDLRRRILPQEDLAIADPHIALAKKQIRRPTGNHQRNGSSWTRKGSEVVLRWLKGAK